MVFLATKNRRIVMKPPRFPGLYYSLKIVYLTIAISEAHAFSGPSPNYCFLFTPLIHSVVNALKNRSCYVSMVLWLRYFSPLERKERLFSYMPYDLYRLSILCYCSAYMHQARDITSLNFFGLHRAPYAILHYIQECFQKLRLWRNFWRIIHYPSNTWRTLHRTFLLL